MYLRVWNATRQCEVASRVEVAASARARRKGLLGRGALMAGDGLWLVPCESIHTFFMRFPIDVLFLDKDGRAIRAIPRLVPWRATRVYLSARSVLELWAGAIDETGTQAGDIVDFSMAPSLTTSSGTS